MKETVSCDRSELGNILGKVYFSDPLMRAIAHKPTRAAALIFLFCFISLFLTNLLNGSLVFYNPKIYDRPFLYGPIDYIFQPILLPCLILAMAHYYGSILNGIKSLVEENIIEQQYLIGSIKEWKKRSLMQSVLTISRYIIPILFMGFVWTTFPTWAPPNETSWLMSHNRIPSIIGFQFLVLIAIEIFILFSFITDTLQFYFFHHFLINKKYKSNSDAIKFIPNHPDRAHGYGVLAPSINWAGIFGMLSFIAVGVAIMDRQGVAETIGDNLFVPWLVADLVLCVVFIPWLVIGPVLPFILMLYGEKKKYLASQRKEIMDNINEEGKIPDTKQEEWDFVKGSRPLIIGKKSILIYSTALISREVFMYIKNL